VTGYFFVGLAQLINIEREPLALHIHSGFTRRELAVLDEFDLFEEI